jgi:hypothetical protein
LLSLIRKIGNLLATPSKEPQLFTEGVVLGSRRPKLTKGAGSIAKAVGYALHDALARRQENEVSKIFPAAQCAGDPRSVDVYSG